MLQTFALGMKIEGSISFCIQSIEQFVSVRVAYGDI